MILIIKQRYGDNYTDCRQKIGLFVQHLTIFIQHFDFTNIKNSYMEVGLLIKKMRENRNISREQMADWLSIAVNTYKKIEYGERAPSLQEIKTISEKLEFDPSLFFKSQGTTIVNNGDYSSGTGNIVINDKDIVMALTKSLDKLANALDKLK